MTQSVLKKRGNSFLWSKQPRKLPAFQCSLYVTYFNTHLHCDLHSRFTFPPFVSDMKKGWQDSSDVFTPESSFHWQSGDLTFYLDTRTRSVENACANILQRASLLLLCASVLTPTVRTVHSRWQSIKWSDRDTLSHSESWSTLTP